MEKYWGNLWSAKPLNEKAAWLKAEEKKMEHIPEGKWRDITMEDLQKALRRLQNWTSAGPDKVTNFWLKHVDALHSDLLRICNESIKKNIGSTTVVDMRAHHSPL